MKKILVTGGCGFLGKYLVNDLIKEFKDIKIKVIDLRNPNNIFKDNKYVEVFLKKDITNYDSIKEDFKDIDTVIHLAGIVSFALKDKDLLARVNVEGTKNIVRLVKENKIKKFIHISSVAALGYKDKKEEYVDESFGFDWEIAHKRKKYYMLTKHLADEEIKGKVNAIILYPGLMFGPGDKTNSAKLINAIKNKKIPFNMPGGTNIIDVRDISNGIIKVMKKDITKGEYLMSGYNLTFKEVNNAIAENLSVKSPRITMPRFMNGILFRLFLLIESKSKNNVELTADNVDSSFKFRYFDNEKAKNELDWMPIIKFEDTIKDTIDWMKKNDLFA